MKTAPRSLALLMYFYVHTTQLTSSFTSFEVMFRHTNISTPSSL